MDSLDPMVRSLSKSLLPLRQMQALQGLPAMTKPKVKVQEMPSAMDRIRKGRRKAVDVAAPPESDGVGISGVGVNVLFQAPTISEEISQVEQEFGISGESVYDEAKPIEQETHAEPLEDTKVSTDTATKFPFDFANAVEDAPEDYQPERASAGRKREPSPFDDVLLDFKGQGWKRVPHDGDVELDERGKVLHEGEVIKEIKRQLQKAQHWHKLGMDLNVTGQHVEFKVRELQKREKNSVKVGAGQTALDENASADGAGVDTDDRDE